MGRGYFLKNIINLLIIILLVVVLISNVFVLQKVYEVDQEVAYLKSNISSIKSDVLSSVNNLKNDFTEQNRWITPVEMSLGEKKENLQQVNLNWQVKDYTQGDQVYFYYRKVGSNNFKKVLAKNMAGSMFGVTIEVALNFTPEIFITEKYSNHFPQDNNKIIEENSRSSLVYEYYVEVQNGNSIRASEKESLDLSKLKYAEFSRINVNVAYIDETKYSFTVYEEMYNRSCNKLENVYIKNMDGIKEKFSKRDSIFTKTIDLEKSPEKIELILEYDTGKTITKEISL